MGMPPPFELGSSKRELAGNTTPTDPHSRRIQILKAAAGAPLPEWQPLAKSILQS
jgi:hypothetical protein